MSTKLARVCELLAQMDAATSWASLVLLSAAYTPKGEHGRPPFEVETMRRNHFKQQWLTLGDPAVEEALHRMPLFPQCGRLHGEQRLPDENTILQLHHLYFYVQHKLAEQTLAHLNVVLAFKGLLHKASTVVDATLICAPSSPKNNPGERAPQMHQSKKGSQWHFGMKAHIGADAHSGLVHTVRGASGDFDDVVEANNLLDGNESEVFAGAGDQGANKRPDVIGAVALYVAMRPGKRKAHDTTNRASKLIARADRLKASVRAKVGHSCRVIQRHFGHMKVRCRGLAESTAQLKRLFALVILTQTRKKLLARHGQVRLKTMAVA